MREEIEKEKEKKTPDVMFSSVLPKNHICYYLFRIYEYIWNEQIYCHSNQNTIPSIATVGIKSVPEINTEKDEPKNRNESFLRDNFIIVYSLAEWHDMRCLQTSDAAHNWQ